MEYSEALKTFVSADVLECGYREIPEKITLEDAVEAVKSIKGTARIIDGYEIPEDLTAESYRELYNKYVDEWLEKNTRSGESKKEENKMKVETDVMINERLKKPFEELMARMQSAIASDDGRDELIEKDAYITIGFLDKTAKIYICPETYEILETACGDVIKFINEEYPEQPIGEHIASYDWAYTGGGIWVATGKLNDGTWFNTDDLDIGGQSFQIFKNRTDAMESYYETVINEIYPSKSKEDKKLYAEMWQEILRHEEETNGEMAERVADWKNELIDILAEA